MRARAMNILRVLGGVIVVILIGFAVLYRAGAWKSRTPEDCEGE